jgi:hypothetical protein
MRSFGFAIAMLLAAAAVALADDLSFEFPDGWFSLETDQAGIVFLLRSYGGDTHFDIVDASGALVDTVDMPEGRTIIPQYRVSPGTYRVRLFDEVVELKTVAGQFAAFGVAVTHGKGEDGKATVWPSFSPVANYTPAAMEQRVTPLAALGSTDFLAPKPLDATAIEFRMVDAPAR